MKSSYIEEHYDEVFFALIEAFRPMKCVELGILHGFSTIHIAKGLKHNFEMKYHGQTKGHLDSYDLFDDYEYEHGELKEVQKHLEMGGYEEFVTVHKGDAYKVWEEHEEVKFIIYTLVITLLPVEFYIVCPFLNITQSLKIYL